MKLELLSRQATRQARSALIDPERVVPLSEGVIVADHSFEVQAANDTAAQLLGWDEPCSMVQDLNDVHLSIFGKVRLREIQVALVMKGRWSGPTLLERRDGSVFPAFVTVCRVHAARDVPAGIVFTVRPELVAPNPDGQSPDAEAFGVKGLPGSFCLHYQPEVDLRDGSVPGCEALLRWWHPGLGMVSPGPALAHPKWAARMAGLETWSIFAACRQAVRWEQQGRRVEVAINVSESHIADLELLGRVRQALVVTGVDASRIAIDLPVQAFTQQPRRARKVAADLHELGVTVVIDGVRDARSERVLADVPASVFKIIPARAGHTADQAADTVEAVALARSRGAGTVAKTVETQSDLHAARMLGFDRAFGHVFSPALAPSELARTRFVVSA